ncbi:phosphate ABC transporter, inner membrane subunit PstC [Methanococcus vannielii SB]|uniref:Phosphate ABC transporter, inner membrane subunit PstC n=1 Tax=Methanococcus vannielii (strain ATCC 35089 / DSM 1224 / JCM 13029 / OCM 148 / SB) TaxID=406327 RepID=A6UPA7_METVS|nr:phosphate ABC transporter permease subunit PstC [Methanococcus vannielii]ABR54329.1 phosphate ABC transporter, inner membrane subunit PstC [Methanococcus vannielii SB]
MRKNTAEALIESVIKLSALLSSAVIFSMVLFLIVSSLPVFNTVSPIDFIFGLDWNPFRGFYGIFPMIVGSFLVTILALAFAIPLGVGCAIFLAELAPKKIQKILRPSIEILTAIPSVVYGFVGMVLFVPLIRDIFNTNPGYSWFSASIILGIMILPTITVISEDAINSVPYHLKEGSLALGATRWQTVKKVILPASLSGIISGIILGMGRAIGETMAVLMVAGNWALIPTSIFDPVRPLTSHIVLNIKETASGSPIYYAMFATGLVLFLMVLILNIISQYVNKKYRIKWD